MGLTNAAANVMSIIAPLLVGYIVKDEKDPAEWRIVFFISAGVYFFGNLIFVLFSSTEIQTWNDPDQRDRRKYPRFNHPNYHFGSKDIGNKYELIIHRSKKIMIRDCNLLIS